MRNIFTALAALGTIAISSTLFAQAPAPIADSIADTAAQVVESVQADAAPTPVADPAIADHALHDHGIHDHGTYSAPMVQEMGQPMPQSIVQQGTIQDGTVMMGQPMVYQHQPVHYHHHQPAKKQTVFGKLMEMERKKNAWLKRTFLGR